MFKGWRSKKVSPQVAPHNESAQRVEKAVSESTKYTESLQTIENGSPEPMEAVPVSKKFRAYGADWMDEVIRDEMKKGTFDQLPGTGKPLYLSDDHSMETLVNHALKTANYLPPWVELQLEIKNELEHIIRKKHQNDGAPNEIDVNIREVNQKIRKYNDSCPSPYLQRTHITNDNIFIQYEKWK